MSAEKILMKIEQDAQSEAKAITDAAAQKAQAVKADILAQAKAQAQAIADKARADAEEEERRAMLIANLEARKSSLASKRAVLDQAFALAAKELKKLDDESWTRLITRIVVEAAETGTETLRVPAADMEKYQGNFLSRLKAEFGGEGSMLDELNIALEKTGKMGLLKLDKTPADFDGGVLLIGEKSDVNGSFDVLLRAVREQYEREVSAILFGQEV